jgi:hypothetical protein
VGKPTKVIKLTKAHCERAHLSTLSHHWEFEISSPYYHKKALSLHASSKGEMAEWMEAIQTAIGEANGQVSKKAETQRLKGGVRTNDHHFFWGTDSEDDDEEEDGGDGGDSPYTPDTAASGGDGGDRSRGGGGGGGGGGGVGGVGRSWGGGRGVSEQQADSGGRNGKGGGWAEEEKAERSYY